ncbi:MFS transporter [Paraphotobacterium marinum]|uniref:MFS transporter n=1 Tax=Paraphotobacterium marinum TaxID=1755811 RepID=UPI001CEFAE44|nr:MFS transporter [Paraphotobacterium marinum]
MKKYIFPLFLGGISLGLTEFVMMGILPQLSQSLKITIPEAGHLISIYALGVVVGSPLLVIFSNKFSPKSILIFLAAFIAISNSLSALSTNYHLMLLVRFLSGLPHGAFFGIGAIVAIKLSPKGKGSAAIAMMFAGLTVANLMMVPVGTSIAIHFSWHYVFLMVGLLGFFTVMSVVYFIPNIDKLETKGLKEDLKLFKKLDIWVSLAIVSFGCGGMFAWYSYIAPLMIHVTKISEIYIPYIMALTGFGMLMGVIVGGKISDRLDPIKSTIYLLIGLIGCLLMVYFFRNSKSFHSC